MSSTEDRLRALAAEHLDVGEDLNFDVSLSDAGVSSVDTVAFLRVIIQEFDVSIPPDDYAQIRTMRDLVGYLDSRAG